MKPIEIFLKNGYEKLDSDKRKKQVKTTRTRERKKRNHFAESMKIFSNLVTKIFDEKTAEEILSTYPLKPLYLNGLVLKEVLPNAFRHSLRLVQNRETLESITILHNDWSVPLSEWKKWNSNRKENIEKIRRKTQKSVEGDLNGLFFIELTPCKTSGNGKKELSVLPHIHGITWGYGDIDASAFSVESNQKAILPDEIYDLIGWQGYFLKPPTKLKRYPSHGGDTMPDYIFSEYSKSIRDLDARDLFFTKGDEARTILNKIKSKMKKQLDEIE